MTPSLLGDPYVLLFVLGALLTAATWFARYIVWPGVIERLKKELREDLDEDAEVIADFQRRLSNSESRTDQQFNDVRSRLNRLEDRKP
jgi:flagellar capping protein FliD